MTFIFDSCILIAIERQDKKIINKINELRTLHKDVPCIVPIIYTELLVGIKKKSLENKKKAISYLELFPILKMGKKTAEILADLYSEYKKDGKAVPIADLIIASHTIENKMTLLTLDKNFEVINELDKIIL